MLRARAEDLFAAQHPTRGRASKPYRPEELVAEMPMGPGLTLRIERLPANGRHRMSMLSFRAWSVTPGGGRIPSKMGFTIRADLLPCFATAIAEALDRELAAMPAWAEPAFDAGRASEDDGR
jgi:hypothetical protein